MDQHEVEARSLLVTALPKDDRDAMRGAPLDELVRYAMDGLARQIAGSTKEHEDSDGQVSGRVPEIILSDDEELVRLDDVLVETFGVSLAVANRKIQKGHVRLNGALIEDRRDLHVPTTMLQGRILQLDKRLALVRAACTCGKGRSGPARHSRTCPVRIT